MANFCPHCGAPLDADARFCRSCGKPVDIPSAPPNDAPSGAPESVKWAARLIFISAAVSVLGTLAVWSNFAGSLSATESNQVNWGAVGGLILVILLPLLIDLGTQIFLGVMILRRRNWARYCFIALFGLSLLWTLVTYHHQQAELQSAGPWVEFVALVRLGLSGAAAYMLLRREAGWWFKNRGKANA